MAINSIANLTDSTVAGSNTQIQYNNSGVFGASSNLTFDGSTLTVTGDLAVTGNTTGVMVIAKNTAGATNITGDGTAVNPVVYTETVDVGGDFASNVFTAPSAGYYHISAKISLSGFTSNHTNGQFTILTTDDNEAVIVEPWALIPTGAVSLTIQNSNVFYMDMGDTAKLYLSISSTDKTVDMGISNNYLSIYKVIV